jgi:hypothetical protein
MISCFFEFYKNFSDYKLFYNQEWNLGRALKGIVAFKPRNERISSFKALFYFHRDCKESWYYIIHQFRFEEDKVVQFQILSKLRFLIVHGDQYWHQGNFIPEDVLDFSRNLIRTTYSNHEIDRLLDFIDEGGITRGSIGQDVYPLIDLIPEKIETLTSIAQNRETPAMKRFWATVILINDYQYDDFKKAVQFIDDIRSYFSDEDDIERLEGIRETLLTFQFMDFRG